MGGAGGGKRPANAEGSVCQCGFNRGGGGYTVAKLAHLQTSLLSVQTV